VPVRVQVPLRLRVDRASLWARGDDLDEALAAALGRALARSRQEVLEPRGGYVSARVAEPTFTWFGEALHEIPPALRHKTEARLRAGIAAAVEESRILEPPGDEPGSEPLPDQASEQVDRQRLSRLFRTYRVPSYGGEGSQDVTVASTTDPPAPVLTEAVELWDWAVIQNIEELHGRLWDAWEGFPKGRVAGAIYRWAPDLQAATPGRIRFQLTAWDFRQQPAPPVFDVHTDLVAYAWVKGKGYARRRAGLPAHGAYLIERVLPAHNPELRLAIVKEYHGADIRTGLTEDVTAAGKASNEAAIEAAFQEQLQTVVADFDADTRFVLVLRTASGELYTISSKEELPALPLPLELRALGDFQGLAFLPLDRPPGEGGAVAGGKDGGAQAREGEGTDQGEGGFIVGPEGSGTEGEFRFPSGPGGQTLTCEPFEDEKPVEELPHSEYIQGLIHQIARRLSIPECKYPANFVLNAAQVIAGHARGVAELAKSEEATTEDVPPPKGALRRLLSRPVPTVAAQLLRLLAGTYPLLRSITDTFHDRDASWLLHFHVAMHEKSVEGVRWIFTYACQIAFLQQLRHSKKQIEARKDNPRYTAFFEELVQGLLADQSRLMLLREQLTRYLAASLDSKEAVARAVIDEWRSAHRGIDQAQMMIQGGLAEGRVPAPPAEESWESAQTSLLAALSPTAAGALAPTGTPGSFSRKGGESAVHDGTRLWTLKELDTAIAMQQGTAESIDPLVKQLLDLPGVIQVLKANPWMTKSYLKQLLDQMTEKNEEITGKVKGDARWAFEKGPISEDLEQATVPGSKYALGGIHLLAHELVGDAFEGDRAYPVGLDYLFDVEQGWRDMKSFFETAGILVLAVLCPEAALVLGILQAVEGRKEAEELRDVYQALIDPDLVTSKAEVEIGLFISELVLAISIIPEAGRIAKGVVGAGETLLKQGVRQGVKTLARTAAEELLESVVRAVQKGLVKAFVKELLVNEVMDAILQRVLGPLQQAIVAELGPPPEGAPTAGDLGLRTADDVLRLPEDAIVQSVDELPEFAEEDE
jgi:hypothetical protein